MAENKLQTSGIFQIRSLRPKISLRSSEIWFFDQLGQHKPEHVTIHDITMQHNHVRELKTKLILKHLVLIYNVIIFLYGHVSIYPNTELSFCLFLK